MSYDDLAMLAIMLFMVIIYFWRTIIIPLLGKFNIERTEFLVAGISPLAPYIDTFRLILALKENMKNIPLMVCVQCGLLLAFLLLAIYMVW